MKKTIIISLTFFISTLKTKAQCAMCKAVVENGDKDLAEGVNSGITFLMLFPYLFLALGLFIYFRNKKRESKN